MHIEDGILPLVQTVAWDGAALAFVIPGIKQAQKKAEQNPAYKPLLAMMGAAVFVVSAMHLPVPVTGSCSHPCATPLAAIVLGPFATAFVSSIVLFFQAIFLGHGGITTLGANTFSMGPRRAGVSLSWAYCITMRHKGKGAFGNLIPEQEGGDDRRTGGSSPRVEALPGVDWVWGGTIRP